jgi:hypothetical protein
MPKRTPAKNILDPQPKVARITSINPSIAPHEGGSCRISILKAGFKFPKPLSKVSDHGYWNASNQPLWLAAQDFEGGTNWILLSVLDMWGKGLQEEQLAQYPHVFIDRINVSGRYHNGSWRFLDLYLKAKHVDKVVEVAGDWILDRFVPGRTTAVLRSPLPTRLRSAEDPLVECWVRL